MDYLLLTWYNEYKHLLNMKKLIQQFGKKLQNINRIRKEYQKKQEQKTTPIQAPASTANEAHQVFRIEIATSTIMKVLLVVFIFLAFKEVVVELKSILTLTAICFFLAIGVSPFVDKLEKIHFPRPLAILLLYLGFFGILGVLFVKMIPIIADELTDISYELRSFLTNGKLEEIPIIAQIISSTNLEAEEIQSLASKNIASLADNLQGIANSTIGVLVGVFQGVFNFIFALVLLFFILMEREQIGNFALLLFPSARREYAHKKFISVQEKMAEWFHGQFILMCCMGIFMYTGMKIFEMLFGMKYAATIGLLAGIMELFPYIGVFLTGLLCIIIAINISWVLVGVVVAWMALAQFLEGNFLVPMVMERVVGLSSVVVILAVAIGGILGSAFGGVPLTILGMIFAVPFAASIAIFVEEYLKRGSKD